MSNYTTELRFICETEAGYGESKGYNSVTEIIAASRGKIFDFDYPIFDPSYKGVLETKIIRHFYTREISEETVGLWKLRLEAKMTEIMPYYNQLYKSALLTFNPFYDTDITKHHSGNSDAQTDTAENSSSTSHNESENLDLYSDTPQGALTGIENENYLTNARKITDENDNEISANSTGKTTAKTTDEYLETVTGKQGGESYSKRLKEFRETFINIDVLVINDLKPLFFNLW